MSSRYEISYLRRYVCRNKPVAWKPRVHMKNWVAKLAEDEDDDEAGEGDVGEIL